MATPSEQRAAADSRAGGPRDSRTRLIEYEEFIERQLRKTRSQVRSVDIAGHLMSVAAASLVYFLLAALVDHWLITGGLGFWGRFAFLAVYLVACGWYLAVEVVPLVVRRINPVYAAHTIERSRPSLKNALVNFLMFRSDRAGISPVVYEAIEAQAATNLAQVPIDSAVDRSKLVRVGYVLVALFFICALYALFSPKNLLRTVGRVAMPWADIDAPTSTLIDEIAPGDARAFRGQQLSVSAHVQGLPAGQGVTLLYSTADGQIVDRAVAMSVPPDGYKHQCLLPAGEASLQQNLTYRIEAGDAVTRPYRVEVIAAPTILVRTIDYKYPGYTGLLASRVEKQGDIKGIEGTEVTIEAVANGPIQSANVDFDCDGKPDLPMRVEGETARATFTLALGPDARSAEHESYQLVFKNTDGQANPQPVRHQIDVSRDLPPEIELVSPKKDEVDLPANAWLEIEAVAADPDFALRTMKLSATSGKRVVLDKLLLDETWRGQCVKKFRFEPRKLGLKSGDVVEYSAAAEDNKTPRPNRAETARHTIRIVSPDPQARNQDQLAQKGEKGEGQRQRGKSDGRDAGHEQAQRGEPSKGDQADEAQSNETKPNDEGNAASNKSQDQNGSQDQSGQADDSQDGQSQDGQAGQGKQGAGQKQVANNGSGEDSSGESGDQSSGDQQGEQAGSDGGGRSGSSAAKGEKGAGKGDSGAAGDREPIPSDGTDDGDAIDQILKHRDEQNPSDNASKSPADENRSADKRERGDEQQSGDEKRSGQSQDKSGGESSKQDDNAQQQPEGQRGDEQRPGGQDNKQSNKQTDEQAGPGRSKERRQAASGQG